MDFFFLLLFSDSDILIFFSLLVHIYYWPKWALRCSLLLLSSFNLFLKCMDGPLHLLCYWKWFSAVLNINFIESPCELQDTCMTRNGLANLGILTVWILGVGWQGVLFFFLIFTILMVFLLGRNPVCVWLSRVYLLIPIIIRSFPRSLFSVFICHSYC